MSTEGRNKSKGARAPALTLRAADYKRLGEWIRAARESRGLQQKPLSRKLGKTDQFLNRVEQGLQRIDVIDFLDLLAELNLSLSEVDLIAPPEPEKL